LRRDNYHFRDVKRLEGNVGYLDLGGFAPGSAARDTAAGAMALLANSDAVIIDLRRCPGGSAEMVNFLASYFFGPEPRVLMTRYFRPTGETVQSATVADIPGKRMPDADLYILTSAGSASACESFAYTLQQYGRARIVGERSAGAGYNNALIPIGYGLTLSVSVGRPIHPRSGKGWQGVGVQPDIEVPAGTALEAAHSDALKSLIAKTSDEGRKRDLTRVIQASQPKPGAVEASPAALQDYTGRYGNKEISVKDSGLFYQRIGGGGGALRALAKDKFALSTDAEITFVRDAKGNVTEMLIEWRDRPQERLNREPRKN
jgi:C-terminal processing protease CtpA/Prc